MLVKKIFFRHNGKIQIRRFSWGKREDTAPLDRNIFCSMHGGFIAATEQDIDA